MTNRGVDLQLLLAYPTYPLTPGSWLAPVPRPEWHVVATQLSGRRRHRSASLHLCSSASPGTDAPTCETWASSHLSLASDAVTTALSVGDDQLCVGLALSVSPSLWVDRLHPLPESSPGSLRPPLDVVPSGRLVKRARSSARLPVCSSPPSPESSPLTNL